MQRLGPRATSVLIGILAFFTSGTEQLARAQGDGFLFARQGEQNDLADNVFLPAPLDLTRHLNAARRALEQQRFSEAVIELGRLLDGQLGDGAMAQDYFVGPLGQAQTRTSLKAEALRLLGSMPPQGREMYELRFGADAGALLEEAVTEGDVQKLAQVTRRYFHTEAGYEATYLMGRYELDRGRPLAAALCFQRLADVPHARAKFEPQLSVLLATCYLHAELPDKARQTLVSLQQRNPQATVTIAGERRQLFQDESDALEWLQRISGRHRELQDEGVSDWVMHRGDASRTARSRGGIPLLNFRWKLPTVNDPTDERTVQEIHRSYVDRGIPPIASLQPLAVDDYIVMRTPHRVIGVDFFSGKRIWEFPYGHELRWEPMDAPPQVSQRGGTPRNSELQQRIWEDVPYGQLSSDGQRVFLIDELATVSPGANRLHVNPFGRAQPDESSDSTNKLVALELRRQGYLQWIVGGEDGEDEPELAGAFFLGSPLPLLGKLYALAELNGEIRLVVLDAQTGRLEWAQQLAHMDTMTIRHDDIRRLSGASPSFADGVLICPTSAGAVVALDVNSRTLLWGFSYETRTPLQFQSQFSHSRNQPEFGDRWMDATATIHQGRVLLTPPESDQMYCLDLLTGEPLWAPKQRGDLLFVAAVHGDKAILVGKQEVTAVNLEDGSAPWDDVVRLPGDDMPSGRGFQTDDHYFLPTTGSRLLRIDLQTGELLDQIDTESVLGNVICYQDEIISQSPLGLKTFFQMPALEQRVVRRLEQDPQDVWALTRRGELLLQQGERQEALAKLREAHRQNAEQQAAHEDEIESLLVRTMLAALREDFAAHQEIATEVADLAERSDQHAEYLRLMAEGFKNEGRPWQSFEYFVELAALDRASDNELMVSPVEFERPERHLATMRSRWVQSNVIELWEMAEGSEREAMRDQLLLMFDEAVDAEGTQPLRHFLDYFGAHRLAADARLELARRLVDVGNYSEAELWLQGLLQEDEPALAAAATGQMARLLLEAGRYEAAAEYLDVLADRWPDQPVMDDLLGREYAESQRDQGALEPVALRRQQWPYGEVETSQSSTGAPSYAGARLNPIRLAHQQGLSLDGISLVFDQQRNLIVRDRYGQRLSQLPLSSGSNYHASPQLMQASTYGHLMLVSQGYELVAFDMMRALTEDANYAVLWRKDLMDSGVSGPRTTRQTRSRSQNTPWGISTVAAIDSDGNVVGRLAPVSPHGVFVQRFRELMCVDPLSGDRVWSRSNVDPGSFLLVGEHRLYVVHPDSDELLVLSAIDGRLIETRSFDGAKTPWMTHGANLLSWWQEGGQLHMQLFDMEADRELWSYAFDSGARATLVGTDEIAVMEPSGQLKLLSLADDRPRIDTQVDEQPDLDGIVAVRYDDQYLIGTQKSVRGRSNVRLTVTAAGSMVDGQLYAFDRESGQQQWQQAADVEQIGLPEDQPAASPAVILMRSVRTNPRGGSRRQFASIAALDRRDGRLLYEKHDIVGNTTSYAMEADRIQSRLVVHLGGTTYTFRFTEKPTPPAPPAQVGDLSRYESD